MLRDVFEVLDCRVSLRSSSVLLLAFEGCTPAIAIDVGFEDCSVMDKAVDGCQRLGGIREDPAPGAEGLIGDDQG